MADDAHEWANVAAGLYQEIPHLRADFVDVKADIHGLSSEIRDLARDIREQSVKIAETTGKHSALTDPNLVIDQRELALARRTADRITDLKYKAVGGVLIALTTAVLMHYLHL